MKNLLRKRVSIVLLLVVFICCSFSVGTFAKEIYPPQISRKMLIVSYQNQKIQPRADIIETKYRIYNGLYQRRRWNRSRNYWVDPYWINC